MLIWCMFVLTSNAMTVASRIASVRQTVLYAATDFNGTPASLLHMLNAGARSNRCLCDPLAYHNMLVLVVGWCSCDDDDSFSQANCECLCVVRLLPSSSRISFKLEYTV